MKKLQLLLSGLLALPIAGGLPAAAQSVDPTFTPTSSMYAPGAVYSTVVQADGKLLAAGAFTRVNGTAVTNLVRFDTGGSLDAAFQQNLGAAAGGYRPRVLANGQIMLISLGNLITAGGLTRSSVLRLNADGTADASFNPGTGATASGSPVFVDDFLPLPSGQTVVVGPFDRFNGVPAKGIVRLTAAGAVDATFTSGTGAAGEIEIVVGLPNGQLLIGGRFASYDGNPCNGLARLNADGTYDASFVTTFNTDNEVINILRQPDGKILLAGYLVYGPSSNFLGLARLLPTGAFDGSFTPPASFEYYGTYSYLGDALQLQPDGKVLVLADGYNATSTYAPDVIRLNADGTRDVSFQPNSSLTNLPYSLTLLANGQVLVNGTFTRFSSLNDRPLVRLNATGALDPSFQPLVQTTGSVLAVVRQADGKLVVGGNFSEINGQTIRRLARFNANGTLDGTYAVNNDLVSPTTSLALQPDGRLVAANSGTVQRYLATGSPDNSFNASGVTGITRVLLQPDGRVLAGGPNLTGGVLRLQANGASDASFTANYGSGRLRYFQSMALQPDGRVLVAGYYSPANGATYNAVVRLTTTGAVDASFTSSPITTLSVNTGLNDLAVQTDGKILVGGQFTAVSGTSRLNVARLNADGTHDTGFVPPSLTGTVNKVLLQPNSRILLGGTFTGAGLPNNLARLLPTGMADASFGATAVPNGAVRTLLVQPDGAIVVGGAFSALNGQAAPSLARITASNVLHVAAPRAVAERTDAWPVPARTALHVAPDASAHPQSLDLLDALGRCVRHQELSSGTPATVAVETLPVGIYLLRVTYAEGTVVRRVQVQ